MFYKTQTNVSGELLIREAHTGISFNPNIHYLRALAAILVLLYHAGVYYYRAYDENLFHSLFPSWMGQLGVAVFFAISGYLMAGLIQRQTPVDFMYRRIIRIFPIFLLISCIGLLMRPAVQSSFNPWSLLLAPVTSSAYPLSVEWTLIHEVFFYVALSFLSLIGLRRSIPIIATVWLAAIITTSVFSNGFLFGGEATPFAYLPLMLPNIAFAVGLLIAHWRITAILPLCAAVICAVLSSFTSSVAFVVMINLTACSMVAAAAYAQPIHISVIGPVLRKLGDYSYSLYLTHALVLLTVFRLLPFTKATMVVALCIALFAGSIFGKIDVVTHNAILKAQLPHSLRTVIVIVFSLTYVGVSFIYA